MSNVNNRITKYVKALESERDALKKQVIDLRQALEGAVDWIDEYGCDCGTDEPGTCALCVALRVLQEVKP